MARSRLPRGGSGPRRSALEPIQHGRKTGVYRRLMMEFLEQRLLMAQDVWTGAGDGKSWQDGHNWSLNAAPGSSDTAVIEVASAVTIDYSGNSSIESVTDDASNGASAAIDITAARSPSLRGRRRSTARSRLARVRVCRPSGSGTTFTASGAADH